MADDLKKTGTPDDRRINVNQDHEVQYWTGFFRCTPEQLRQAVKTVGVMVKDVEAYFETYFAALKRALQQPKR